MESPQSAMDKLLEKLDERDYEGKWQIFKQALKDDGNKSLCRCQSNLNIKHFR